LIAIEVVYAAVGRQVLLVFEVQEGTTVRAALAASGIADEFAELDLASCPVGIFGKVVADPDGQVVQAADRLEIYRPLLADPKEIRRLRAAKAAEAKQRG
jgi:putative ubiquitin-RnfH superfamily antitoxin RatB of RatAB toxin-antitoxin module